MDKVDSSLQKAKALKIEKYSRHILLCAGPKCCSSVSGDRVWDALKDELNERGLSAPAGSGDVFRTKVHCLRICSEGPIAVVYPEGTWYKNINEEGLRRIIDSHLQKGEIVKDLVLAENDRIRGV